MRGFASIFVFLLFAFSGLEELHASRSYRVTIPNLRFTSPDGQRYRVRTQTFRTRCDSNHCYFYAGDYRLRVNRSQVQIHNEERTYNPTYFTPSTGGELGRGGAYDRGYVGQIYSSDGASPHLECYQRLRDDYTSRFCPDRTSLPSISGCRGPGTKRRTDSIRWCARYVRFILHDCEVLPENSIARHAENAGPALERQGFRRLSTLDPDSAPLGSIIVYGGTCPASPRGADPGHIEIKTGPSEYTSDYIANVARSEQTGCRRVTGIYFR
jgi:hypothetical protein